MPESTKTPARSSWLPYSWPWLAFALLTAVVLQARGIVSKTNTHDLYVVFDGIWRIFSGQQIFVDFHSPLGIAYYLPYMVLRHFEPFSLVTMFHGNLLVAATLLILATVTLRKRLAPALFFWAALGIVAVAISPRTADMGITIFSHLAPYNRWCEAATMLAAPLLLLPRSTPGAITRWGGETDVVGGLTLGLLALFAFHIKINFFLCIAGLALTGLIFQTVSWRTVGLAVVLCAVVSAGLEATLHLHRPYFADLDMAVKATMEVYGKVNFSNVFTAPLMFAGYLIGAAVLVALVAAPHQARSRWHENSSLLWMVGIALAMAAATNLQVSPQAEIPLMGAITLVVLENLRRRGVWATGSGVRKGLFYLVALGLVATTPTVEAAAIVLHGVQSRTQGVCPLPILRGTVGEQLLFTRYALRASRDGSCAELTIRPDQIARMSDEDLTSDMTRLEVARLTDSFGLLRKQQLAGRVLLPLDFANPVSSLTGSPSPRGALLWFDLGRNYSLAHRPDPVTLLNDVDFVLQSRLDPPLTWERHGENAWKVYGAEVTHEFKVADQGRLWRLWSRGVEKTASLAPVP